MRFAGKGEGMPQRIADTGGMVVRGCLCEGMPLGADSSEGMPTS